jgi:flagellin
MSLAINTNIAALIAQRSVSKNSNNLSATLKKLSSGLRINSAADDASGMLIADSLRSQRLGLGQAVKNANDGISMLQVADGALEESINIIHTIKQKTIQAASDGQTAETRRAIQSDIDKLLDEFDMISKSTSFNGQKLLSGNFTNKHIQVGAYSGETANINISTAESTKVGHVNASTIKPSSVGTIQFISPDVGSDGVVRTVGTNIQYNNKYENGLGKVADDINKLSEKTNIKAIAQVKSEASVISGNTGSDFKINGILIGNIKVDNNDADGSLVKSINNKTLESGVLASVSSSGALQLNSVDGRAIKVEGIGKPPIERPNDLSTLGELRIIKKGFNTFQITQSTQKSNEIVFIDKALPNYQQLSAGVSSSYNIVYIEAGEDGLAKITQELKKHTDLDAVHILSHGEAGLVNLGSFQATKDSVIANSSNFEDWGESISDSGDILLYGCDVVSNADGLALIQNIASLTSADVVASTDKTGAVGLGGDWDLEANIGSIETPLAINQESRDSWNALMGTYTLASQSTGGVEANNSAIEPQISGNGRYITFTSQATNLDAFNDPGVKDVFRHDIVTGETLLISKSSGGVGGNGESIKSSVSDDGRYIAFASMSTNLSLDDADSGLDIFLHDVQTSQTTLISKATDGTKGQGLSTFPQISGDGRFVVFSSISNNLVAGDTNNSYDVFLHNVQTGQTTLISKATDGTIGNDDSTVAGISDDGRYIVFQSSANNLDIGVGDTNGVSDIFLHDTQTGTTNLISKADDGSLSNGYSLPAKISDDGNFVVYSSDANNLVAGDTNGLRDVFLYDVAADTTARISKADDGTQGDGWSHAANINSDGRYIAFSSNSSNLVPPGDDGIWDVFLYDTQLGQMTRMSVTEDGSDGGNSQSDTPAISDDGQFVVFKSSADNLILGTTPGIDHVYFLDINAAPPPNNPPTMSLIDQSPAFTEVDGPDDKSAAVVINNSIQISDPDGTDPKSATVNITNVQSGDELLFTDTGTIQGSYNNGVLTLTAVGGQNPTEAEFEAALSSVEFNNTSDTPSTTDRTIEFKVTDTSDDESVAVSEIITVTEIDDTANGGGQGGNGVSNGWQGSEETKVPLLRLQSQSVDELIPYKNESYQLDDVCVLSFEDAQIAMELADASLTDLDRIRSDIGSSQNQLESTISNISTTMVQVASAESTIRDVDFAEESSVFSKMNILIQAGTFALAQANTIGERVLQLLQ